MDYKVTTKLQAEGCRILFRNFAGAAKEYNPAGRRQFALVLPPAIADAMSADGWNVRPLPPKEPGDAPLPIINVNVSFKNSQPNIYLLPADGSVRTRFHEDMVGELDKIQFVRVPYSKFTYGNVVVEEDASQYGQLPFFRLDLLVSPYNWNTRNGTGVSAYLQRLFGYIVEDELEAKYRNIPIGG